MATILEGDIKLLASRVMDDVPEGGGGPTGTEIPYGTSNAMFQDITEADRAGGNVSIRQAHVGVLTANVEPYLGANLILSELPNDPNVSITLARCDLFARRTAIAAAIANYLIQGTTWSGVLLEDHVVGMLSIQILHRPGTPAPDIGRTLVLVYQQGTSSERIQYVRVTRTETEARTFTYGSGGSFVDFQASVTKVDLQDALRYAFPGSPPSRDFAPAAGKTVIRDTTVADAATYYGASPIVGTVALGDSVLRVQSIYTQLVPSSRTETSTLDQRPAAERTLVLAEAPRRVEVPVAAHSRRIRINQSNRGSSYVALLKPLPEPGTVVISYRALGNWYALTDDGNGVLIGPGSGRVIYNTGSLDMALQSLPDDASSIIIQWAERVAYTSRAAQGAQIRAPEVAWQMARRGTVPGTWTVRWPSGGVMRTASDNGAGKITGDAQGEYDYPSSSAFMRLGAIIDPGGEYEVTYDAGGMEEEVIAAPALDAAGQATLVLTKQPLAGSIEVAWKTAQEVSSTSGTSLSAAEAGKVIGTTKTVMGYVPQTVYGTVFSGSGGNVSTPPVSSVTAPVSMVQVPIYRISNNSTTSTWSRMTAQDATDSRRVITAHSITDDGAGGFIGGLGTVSYAGKTIVLKLASQDHSTVSYKSDHEDAKVFDDPDGPQPSLSSSSKGGEYGTTAVGEQQVGSVIVRYKVAPVSSTTAVERFAGAEIVIDLLPYTTDRAVPGSVRFAWMGETYEDFEGILYRGRTSSAPGIASGSMDYAAGLARMTDYVVGPSPTTVTLQSLWTRRVPWSTGSIFFRTQSAPLKPGGVVLSVLDLQGTALTATTGTDGSFVGTHMRGRMDFESGVGELQFGDFVDPATLTDGQKAEWWYSAADVGSVEAGKIWRPWPVDPTTLRINSVSYSYLPIDADILGLDPVRLPPDGRVPIYRKGTYVVVGHTGRVPAATYSAGMTINCGRARLSRVYLVGADGKLIRSGYTPNLDAGTIAVTDVTGWVQPVVVKHRVEEMARCTDVQIDGTLHLSKQLSHAYPAGAIVSSAIMAGNLRARALPVFDQGSWDGFTWADSTIGNPAPAGYNDGAFPPVVTNAGALTERFALRILSGGTDVEVIGEHVGNVGTYSRNTDIAPINPVSGAPYFVLRAAGWGSGWAAGNTLFLPTVGVYFPFAAIRTVQPSEAVSTDYAFEIAARGDVDRAPTNPVI